MPAALKLHSQFFTQYNLTIRADLKNLPESHKIFAGTPPTIVLSGTSFVTTAPAATIELIPTVTPGSIVAPAPTHAPLLMVIDFKSRNFLFEGSSGWFSVVKFTRQSTRHLQSLSHPELKPQAWLIKTFLPMVICFPKFV